MPLETVSPLTAGFPILRSALVAPAILASFPLSPTSCPPWKKERLRGPSQIAEAKYHLESNYLSIQVLTLVRWFTYLATINVVILYEIPSRHPSFLPSSDQSFTY